MQNIQKILLTTILVFSIAFSSEVIDHGQCKDYYKLIDATNDTYEIVQVCGPTFPRIDSNIVLNQDKPVYILPAYNFSVKIAENTLKDQLTTVIENRESILDFKEDLIKSTANIDALNNHVNSQFGLLQNQINNVTIQVQKELQILQNEEYKDGSSDFWVQALLLALIAVAGVFAWNLLQRRGKEIPPDELQNTPLYDSEPQTLAPTQKRKKAVRKRRAAYKKKTTRKTIKRRKKR